MKYQRLTRFLFANLWWVVAILAINGVSGWARAVGSSYLGKISNLIENKTIHGLWQLVAVGAAIMVSSYSSRWVTGQMCQYLSEKLALRLRLDLVGHLKQINFLQYEKLGTGNLLTIFRQDVKAATEIIYIVLSRMGNNVFLFLFSAIIMLRINVKMTVIIIGVVLVTAIINQQILKKQKQHQVKTKNALGNMSSQTEKSYQAIDTVKTHWVPEFVGNLFNRERIQYNQSSLRSEMVDVGRLSLYNLVNSGILFVSLLYLGYRGIMGNTSIGDVLVYLYLVKQIMLPVEMVFRWMSNLVGSTAAWECIDKVFDIPERKQEKKTVSDMNTARAEHITFQYDDNSHIIKNQTVSLQKGELTRLAGKSGSGKTTIIKILLGLYKSETAQFYADEKKLPSLYGLASYASIAESLFPLSIYENIALGNPEVTREKCMDMMDKLGFAKWTASLPKGINTVLEEKALSGGQQQSIANARAFLSGAPIVILDEPFSALDVENENLLKKEINRQKQEKLILLTSHRDNNINNIKTITL